MRNDSATVKKLMATAGVVGAGAAAWHNYRYARDIERRNPPMGKFVELEGGQRLHYVEAGEGPPVVLIHGASLLLQDMTSSLMPVLAAKHRVVAFDRPGHGWSTRRPYRAWDEAQARTIHEGVRRLGLEKPVIVGHSIGGGIAMSYGMEFAEELTGVVFLSGLAFTEIPSGFLKFFWPSLPLIGTGLSYSLYPFLLPRMIGSLHQLFFDPQEMPDRLRRELPTEMLYRPEAIKMNAEDQISVVLSLIDLQIHYRNYPLPVVVMGGSEDRTTDPQKHAVTLAKRLPSSRLHIFPGLGHMIHHFAQEEIAQAVEDLFEGTPARPS